jgi:hypothetical protein
MLNGFIRYDNRSGKFYASHYIAKRVDGKKVNEAVYLGLVIDKEKGIFKNRERGTYSFSLQNGYGETIQAPKHYGSNFHEKEILIFGNAWLLDEILKKTGLKSVLTDSLPDDSDTFLSLLAYKILDHGFASKYANEWWEDSYAKIIYPKADLRSQRISEFLTRLGNERNWRNIYKSYLAFISNKKHGHPILIDSTGLPNDIKFDLTAINNHNGVISNELRLILVLDKITGLPIYFRYVPGNIVDVSTLKTTLNELSSYGLDVEHAIVDAGYYSDGNIEELVNMDIPFVIRMGAHRKIYKKIIAEHLEGLEHSNNLQSYRNRFLYIKKVKTEFYGKYLFAYLIIDIDRKNDEFRKYAASTVDDKSISREEMQNKIKSLGVFVILSAEDVDENQILPIYFARQSIEQVFDIAKNNVDILPVRIHNEDTLRGHLMLSFLATSAFIFANQILEGTKVCAIGAFHVMKSLKIKVYEKNLIIQEPTKKMNDIIKHLKLSLPC